MSDKISGFEYIKKHDIKKALAVVVDGIAMDLATIFDGNTTVEVITKDHPLALGIMRHTTAHIMAQALQELYPQIKIAIGPTIENGFYYDVQCDHQIIPDDFDAIEKKMRAIIKADYKITREIVSKATALEIFSAEPFKQELIRDLDVTEVSIYRHEDKFVDLCRGPHLPKTGMASPHFKIMKLAGAYWRGDSKRDMLQRIYATAWFSQEDLDTYVQNLAEAEKRDHRKIGKDMDLFHTQEEAVGSVFWHPNGWVLYRTIQEHLRKYLAKDGYQEVSTPQMIDRSLWEASGHWEKFWQNMFIAESEERILAVKPMNCPGQIQIFKQGVKSYRDLPFRLSEFGMCHRNEPSGALYGTMRVRAFIQDDGHIFCTQDQMAAEIKKFCNLLSKVYRDFGFESFDVKFSDRPEVRAGSDDVWDMAENLLWKSATEAGLDFSVNKGEGAFYGPKLEFVLKDKLGRDWQCGTLQVDLILPERLGVWYTGEDGAKHRPILLHRAILGSLERFIGILLENYAGKLPLWLSPVQIVVATITNDSDVYAEKFFQILEENNIRARLDLRPEKISYKIREHSLAKVPLMAVLGANESASNTVTIRKIDGSQETLSLENALLTIKKMCLSPVV
ncbi:MAG: threonine--tRNA ligase [Holosporaceae bacterium]|jgi:threonyl-tRNA synthetase|nr:threonine--tRNA ligase [Holosporaceae bacterium]